MRAHEQVGRPPTLRPRTAGTARSTRAAPSATLSATASGLCASPDVLLRVTSPPLEQHTEERVSGLEELGRRANDAHAHSSLKRSAGTPVVLPSRAQAMAPARPKSANLGAGHGSTSQHRMDRIQVAINSVTPHNSGPSKDLPNQLAESQTETTNAVAEQSGLPSKQDDVRTSTFATERVQSAAAAHGARIPVSLLQPGSRLAKRPLSAAPMSILRQHDEPRQETPILSPRKLATGAKRPHSAASREQNQAEGSRVLPWMGRTRNPSLVKNRKVVEPSGPARDPDRLKAQEQATLQLEPPVMGVMATYHRHAFVYAVPLHCVEPGRQYNPYHITAISHENLFDRSGGINQQYEAKCDYYTISSAGFTFHVKDDNFKATFVPTVEWEREKLHFDKISRLPSFQLGMQEVQHELSKLETVQFVRDFEGSMFSLPAFTEVNAKYLDDCIAEVCKINASVQAILVSVCHDCLHNIESPHGRFPGHEFAVSTRKSSNFHLFDGYVEREMALATADAQFMLHEHFQQGSASPSRLSPSKPSQLRITRKRYLKKLLERQHQRPQDRLNEIRWTMAAIRRRKCLHLTKFAKLVEFMQIDVYFAVIIRSVAVLYNHLLRGANAAQIRKLTAREDYVLAFHKTLDVSRNNPDASAGEEASGTSKISSHISPDSHSKLTLTKQDTKRFLRAAWNGKFDAHGKFGDDTRSAPVWMESTLESLFFQALLRRFGEQMDSYGLNDLLDVVEADMQQQLVLPEFVGARHSIFAENDRRDEPTSDSPEHPLESSTNSSDAETIQNIAILAPSPLFRVDLELSTIQQYEYEIKFRPGLDEIANLVKSVINGFVDVFNDVPPLTSHPELHSILKFAGNVRSSALPMTNTDQEPPVLSIAQSHRAVESNNAEEHDSDDEEASQNNAERLTERINEDNDYNLLRIHIDELIANALDEASQLVDCYTNILLLHSQNERMDFSEISKRFRENEYSLMNMIRDMTNLNEQTRNLNALRASQDVEFLHVDIQELQKVLLPSPMRCLKQFRELFPTLAHEKCEQFLAFVRSSCRRIQKPIVPDLEAFANYLLQLRDVYDEVKEKENDLAYLGTIFQELEKLEFSIPAPTSGLFDLCEPEFLALKGQVTDATGRRETDINEYTFLLNHSIKQLEDRIGDLKNMSSDQAVSESESSCQQAREISSQLEKESRVLVKQSDLLIWIQGVLADASSNARQPTNEFADLKIISAEVELKTELWDAVCEAEEYLDAQCDETLRDIDVSKMKAIVTHMQEVFNKLQRSALRIPALKRLHDSKNTIEGLTPVIRDLRNENLHERHWTKLEHKLQCSFSILAPQSERDQDCPVDDDNGDAGSDSSSREVKYLDLPLRHLLDIQAVSHATAIHQVSEEATAESAIEKSFESVLQTWEVKEIPTSPKKDRDGREAHCLGECEEILALLEESEVLLRVMDFSSYARSIQTKLTRLLIDLAHTKEAVELLQVCQQKWEYMQRLASADFLRSFPEQAKILQLHDTKWRTLIETLAKRPLCMRFGVSADNRHSLHAIIEGFEMITKSLAEHLEVKRQIFPAFFRLSNFELATLLSRSRDVNNIQKFLYQCFDNVSRIGFGARDSFQDILSITSRAFPEAEVIQMGKNLKARGPPEQWLAAVEKRLAEQLRRKTKEIAGIFSELASTEISGSSPLECSDLSTLPMQSVLLADSIVRCQLVDIKFKDAEHKPPVVQYDELRRELRKYHHAVMKYLLQSPSDFCETQLLSSRELALRSTLLVQDIQFRDTLAIHFESLTTACQGNRDAPDGRHHPQISWDLQLKYGLDDSTTVGQECHVKMNGLEVPYGFHYVDPNGMPIISPGSMRTLFSLFACIRNAQGCILVGPAGSGKSTTALQVSRLLGRQYFGTRVNSSTTISHALRLLRGALQSGGTFFFSATESAPSVAEIVKTIASLFANIEHSVLTKLPISGLQKDPIVHTPGTALILARRVQYSSLYEHGGKQDYVCIWSDELSQFDVLGCDLDYVVEALLASSNFESPRVTARKMLAVWFQVRSACSSRVHDSFSFQAVKDVIQSVAAMIAKSREHFEKDKLQAFLLREELVQCFSKDDSLSKTAQDDLTNIVESVFQNGKHRNEWFVKQWRREQAEANKQAYGVLEPYVEAAARSFHLVTRHELLEDMQAMVKCLISSVGVILCGRSGSGKTTAHKVLARAIDLYKQSLPQAAQELPKMALDQQQSDETSTETAIPPGSVASEGAPQELSASQPDIAAQKEQGSAPSDSAVTTCVIFPMALTLAQLYGSTSLDGKGRTKSVIGRLVRLAQEMFATSRSMESSALQYQIQEVPTELLPLLAMEKLLWVVFDGSMSMSWLESLSCILTRKPSFALLESALDPTRRLLKFHDGEFMTVPPNIRFLFETWSMKDCSPGILSSNSVICFDRSISTTSRYSSAPVSAENKAAEQIHIAYIKRFLSLQREKVALSSPQLQHTPISLQVCDIIEKWFVDEDLLENMHSVIEEYGYTVQLSYLQRVANLLSLLQVLLNEIAMTTRKVGSTGPTMSGNVTFRAKEEDSMGSIPRVQVQIEMSIVYALMWGFAGCISDNTPLQLLIQGMIKSKFEHIEDTWAGCGKDCNLFDTLIDLAGLRFVSVFAQSFDSTSLSQREGSGGAAHGFGLSCLFVPTPTSLQVHAVMKEGIRSGRGILLIGNENARRTTLLRNFLSQVDVVNAIINDRSSSKVIIAHPSSTSDALTRQSSGSDSIARTSNGHGSAVASVERIRFHQISLVTRLAAKFRRLHHATRGGSFDRRISTTKIPTTQTPEVIVDDTWNIDPSFRAVKPDVTEKFDNGDYVPFFFTMNRHNRGISDIAQCMERMLQRERTGVFEPPPGKIAILIIDDLHLPIDDSTGGGSDHPSCHEYLRSVYEHAKVYAGDEASTVRIENLLLVASVASQRSRGIEATETWTSGRRYLDESFTKLADQFFPVLAPSCTLRETHQIFITLCLSQWECPGTPLERLPQAVCHVIPLFVAATTVLWEKLRRYCSKACESDLKNSTSEAPIAWRHCCFALHDLTKVYEGICSVSPSYLLDIDTLIRLWTHECIRTFSDPFDAAPTQKSRILMEIWRLRDIIESLDYRQDTRALSPANNQTMSMVSSKSAGASPTNPSQLTDQLSASNATGYLAFLSAEYLNKKPTHDSNAKVLHQRALVPLQEQHCRAERNLWGFVPTNLFYRLGSLPGNAHGINGDNSLQHRDLRRLDMSHRSSIKFLRRMSFHDPSSSSTQWIYAEIYNEDASDETISMAAQQLVGAVRAFSTTNPVEREVLSNLLLSTQLPKRAPPVSNSLASTIAHIDRVHARVGSKTVLLGQPGCGREFMLRYVCASRGSTLRQEILTIEGLPDADVVAMKWRVLIHELYERIGVDCENVTLIVKRVDLLPGHVMSQLLNLMSTGEIPGCFTLKEQIKMATRVRDEHLVEIESKFHAQNAQIRQEVELQREKELTAIKREEKEMLSLHDATFYQEFERIHQQTLAFRLAQAQLRYQQDCDDYTRKCEVETESVTATIMSLMRPLGITSGRWQQIIDRIRKRLRIVFIVDYNHHDWTTSRAPELLSLCNVVTTPIMLASDLHTLFYGHFHSEVQRLMRLDRFAVNPEIRKWEDFVAFMKRVEHALPDITKMAVEIHLSATKVASRRHQSVPTWLGMVLPTYFAKALEKFYSDASETLSKAEWFLYVCESMEKDLSKLRDGDDELRERLRDCGRKITILEEAILQQQEDGDRIRDMMRRFQESAEEQVQITNEMEKQAQVELNVPLACLEEANAALLLIEKRHIIEIKSFNSPPLLVHLVFDAICVMFGMEPAWDNARKILSDASVVQNMLNYDKDNMSDDIISKLQSQYISDDRFHREEVEKQSVAASMIVIWVRAIHQYASTRRVVKPTLDKLEKAQSRLRLLMQEYQVSKQRVADADEQLLQLKNTLGETIALKQSTTDEIESRASRLESGESVLEFLSEDRQQQEKTVERMHKTCHHGLAWWNALFDAALLAYAGRFHFEDRKTLFAEWECAYWRSTQTDTDHCETKCCLVPSIHVALREKDEEQDEQDYDLCNNEFDHDEDVIDLFCERGPDHAHWELVSGGGVCFSRRRLQDVFFLGQVNCAAFPAVLITKYTNEIEDLVLKCARNLWKWNEFFMVSCKAEDFDQVFVAAVAEGHQLLILDVEPSDGVTHFSNLSSVFNWRTTLENGVEHLAVKSSSTTNTTLDSSLPLANASSTAGEAKMELIPVHSSLRLILTSYKPQSAFGEATLRLPTLDATLYVSEIPDVILDKMWNPGFYENAESTKLKLAIRDYHAVAHIGSSMQDELTKRIQQAAVHGDFQVAEMQVLREQVNAIKELRVTLQRKRMDVEKEIAHTRKLHHIAKLGAVTYNSFNTTISAHARLSRSMVRSPSMGLHLFLPLFFSALKPTPPPSSLQMQGPHSSQHQQLQRPQSPMLSSSTSGVADVPTPPMVKSAIKYLRQKVQVSSSETLVPTPTSLNSTAEILQQMLNLLMPLISCQATWDRFTLQLICDFEENHCRPQRGARQMVNAGKVSQSSSMAHSDEATIVAFEGESTNEIAARTGNKTHAELRAEGTHENVENAGCSAAFSPASVKTILTLRKLNWWKMSCTQEELANWWTELCALEPKCVISLILRGAIVDEHETKVPSFFATSRSRSERIKIGLTLFPQLSRQLCDQMLELYGVQIQFSTKDEVSVPLLIEEKPAASIVPGSPNTGRGYGSKYRCTNSSRFHRNNDKYGWLRSVAAYPEMSGVLIISHQPFHSFAFLQRAFFQTVFIKEIRLAILQQLFSRSFHAPAQLNDLFLLPRSVFLSNASQQQALLESGSDLQINPLLMIKCFDEIQRLERDKPDVLETASLALVNMQENANPLHWENLFHILHRTHQHTTSTVFVRHTSIDDNLPKVGPSGGPMTPRQQAILTEPGIGQNPTQTATKPTISPGAPLSSLSLPPVTRNMPTARRLSTAQSLLHRHSDISLVTSVYPRFLAVVDNWATLPVHMQSSLLCMYDTPIDWNALGANSAMVSFKKCLQSTILRFGCHPCRELLETSLLADETSKFKLAMAAAGFDLNALANAKLKVPCMWQLLSSLVLFHSLLIFRSSALSRLAGASWVAPPPGGNYSFDSFVTALDQLFHSVMQFKALQTASKDAIFERFFHQLILGPYARQAIGKGEVCFLRYLYRECYRLMDTGRLGDSAEGSAGLSSSILNEKNSNERSAKLLQNATFRRKVSSVGAFTRRTSSSFLVGGSATGSASAPSSPRSASTASTSTLSFINFPLETLHTKTTDVDQWLELWWNYTEDLEKRYDAQLCALFSGLDPTGNASFGDGGAQTLGELRRTSNGTPSWLERFGWEKQSCQGDAFAASISIKEAHEAIQALLRTALAPPLGEDEPRSWLDPSATLNSLWVAYGRQAKQIKAYLEQLLAHIEIQDHQHSAGASPSSTTTTSATDQSECDHCTNDERSLLHIRSQSVRDQVLALLQNEIPRELWSRLGAESSCCFGYVMAPEWSLDDLLAHYLHWSHFLREAQNGKRSDPLRVWAPALSPAMSLAHVIDSAKTEYCEQHALDADDGSYAVAFALQVDSVDRSSSGNNELKDDPNEEKKITEQQHERFPDGTFAVVDGVLLHGAFWNQEFGYLEPLRHDTHSHEQQQPPASPLWQQVRLLCTIQEQPQSRGSLGSNSSELLDTEEWRRPILTASRISRRHGGMRSCPFLAAVQGTGGHESLLLYEIELPVEPSLRPLATPYLTLATR